MTATVSSRCHGRRRDWPTPGRPTPQSRGMAAARPGGVGDRRRRFSIGTWYCWRSPAEHRVQPQPGGGPRTLGRPQPRLRGSIARNMHRRQGAFWHPSHTSSAFSQLTRPVFAWRRRTLGSAVARCGRGALGSQLGDRDIGQDPAGARSRRCAIASGHTKAQRRTPGRDGCGRWTQVRRHGSRRGSGLTPALATRAANSCSAHGHLPVSTSRAGELSVA